MKKKWSPILNSIFNSNRNFFLNKKYSKKNFIFFLLKSLIFVPMIYDYWITDWIGHLEWMFLHFNFHFLDGIFFLLFHSLLLLMLLLLQLMSMSTSTSTLWLSPVNELKEFNFFKMFPLKMFIYSSPKLKNKTIYRKLFYTIMHLSNYSSFFHQKFNIKMVIHTNISLLDSFQQNLLMFVWILMPRGDEYGVFLFISIINSVLLPSLVPVPVFHCLPLLKTKTPKTITGLCGTWMKNGKMGTFEKFFEFEMFF